MNENIARIGDNTGHSNNIYEYFKRGYRFALDSWIRIRSETALIVIPAQAGTQRNRAACAGMTE